MCSRSSSSQPSAASMAMVSMLRVLRSSPGRDQTSPQATSVVKSWKSLLKGVAFFNDESTQASPRTCLRTARPRSYRPGVLGTVVSSGGEKSGQRGVEAVACLDVGEMGGLQLHHPGPADAAGDGAAVVGRRGRIARARDHQRGGADGGD